MPCSANLEAAQTHSVQARAGPPVDRSYGDAVARGRRWDVLRDVCYPEGGLTGPPVHCASGCCAVRHPENEAREASSHVRANKKTSPFHSAVATLRSPEAVLGHKSGLTEPLQRSGHRALSNGMQRLNDVLLKLERITCAGGQGSKD